MAVPGNYLTPVRQAPGTDFHTYTQIARVSKRIPALKSEIENGTLQVSKAKRILPVLTEENQEFWIEKAKASTRVELEKVTMLFLS